jgi:molybdate transport system substrate-binding protein
MRKWSGTLLRLFGGGRLFAAIILALSGMYASDVRAADASVAVAANFTDAAKEIGAAFQKATGHKAVFSFGSTGQLFTQITQEAPFEVFLAADRQRPEKAAAEGLAVPGTSFTYATGRIVLFSKDRGLVAGEQTLRDGRFTRLAIANPATAPYGAAAIEAMKALGVYETLSAKLVQGNNISQAYQFVETGNAELGFVAMSQIAGSDEGSRWIVPASLYTIISQDAVLLKKGADNEAARAFVAFLKGHEARAIKEKYGYGAGD